MMTGWVLGTTALPILVAIVLAACYRRMPSTVAHRLALLAMGIAFLCTLALLAYARPARVLAVEWLPGMGTAGLDIGGTGVYVASITAFGGLLVLLGVPPDRKLPPLSGALVLLTLAAANAAFMVDHFAARYAALEVVALCVALALLIEVRDAGREGQPQGSRLSRSVYLALRLGDAGLLTAILVLMHAGDTLQIAPALEVGKSLGPARLHWTVAGFLLAVWVKLGGWPLHLWNRAGRRLRLVTHLWMYAAVMPSLGAYLLYRVTPLLVLSRPLQELAWWLGAVGASVPMLILHGPRHVRSPPDLRSAMAYLGAAQGGILLFAAASGAESAVWLGLLAMPFLRLSVHLSMHLAANAAQSMGPLAHRRAGVLLFVGAGLALTAFSSLTTWWARQANAPGGLLLLVKASVVLTGAWVARVGWRLSRMSSPAERRPAIRWNEYLAVALLACLTWVGGIAFDPLARHLSAVGPGTPPDLPSSLALLRYALTPLALLVVPVLMVAASRLRLHLGLALPGSADRVCDVEAVMTWTAQTLRSAVEVGLLEHVVALVVRAVRGGARATHRLVEQRVLERSVRWLARAVIGGARVAYLAVEQAGLGGFLRWTVRTALILARWLRGWHTGRLRRSLSWVVASLGLAVLVFVLCDWR